jgi:hypothetical protein
MTIAVPIRWLGVLLAVCVAATATMADGSSTVTAQSPTPTPTLGLPAAADRGKDRVLVPAPIGPATAGRLDLGKVQAAAVKTAASLPEQQWDVAELAWSTSGDPLTAFHFVRDHIRLEPYAGILRGPDGTLAARAGNSEDRALLLKSMLDSMQVRSRFAVGDLDDAAAGELLALSLAGAPAPLPATRAVDARSMDGQAIGVRARRDYAVLQAKVGAMLEPDVDVDNAAALAALRHHIWLQIRYGTEWLDYDTTRPDAEPGQRLTAVQSTVEELPASDYQSITVRVVTESVSNDQLVEKTSLEAVFPAWDLAGSEVFLYFQPRISSLGGTILQALGEAVYWEPELMVDSVVQTGSAFQVLSGQDLFDPGASPDPLQDSPLAGVRLEVQRDIPGQPSQTFAHVILDRVSASARAAGNVTQDVLTPMDGGGAGPTALVPIIHLMASTGGSNPRNTAVTQAKIARFVDELSRPDAASDYELGDLLWPVAVADQSLVTASERVIVPALDDGSDGHAFVADARVYLTSFGPGGSSGSGIQVATDLLADGVRIIAPSDGQADGALRRMWYGTLQTALETQFVYEILSSVDADGRQVLDVSDSTGSTLAVLAPDDPGSVPPGAAPALRDAIASGLFAVVPGDPATSTTWWTIDPRDGTTRSIIDPGYGSIFGGGNYVNEAPPGGAHYVDDQGNRLVRKAGGPKPRCRAGQEYVTLIGCVSIPAAWAIRITVGVAVLVAVYYANRAYQDWRAS